MKKKFFKILMVGIMSTFVMTSCTQFSKQQTEEVYEHSYRSEPLGKNSNQYINIPSELPNFSVDYFDNSRMLPPLFQTRTEGIFYAMYPVDIENVEEEYYGVIVHTIRGNLTVTPLIIEHCYRGNCDYWIYNSKEEPVKSDIEEVKTLIKNLIDNMKKRV